MELLSPPKACDPWAVFSARRTQQKGECQLRPVQRAILSVLSEAGPLSPGALCERLQIDAADLERELATLRHMEKVRGELRNNQRLIMLWDTPRLDDRPSNCSE